MALSLNALAAQRMRVTGAPVYPGLPIARSAATRRSPLRGATLTQPARDMALPVEVLGMPSVTMRRLPEGGMAVTVKLKSRYAPSMPADRGELHSVAGAMVERAENMSQGPYKARDLRRMGHPYGRFKGVPNNVPRGFAGKSLVHVKGVRGSVPNLSVVNRQSGIFSQSWEYQIKATPDGAEIELINAAPYAAFLAMGTRRMQAHGPFSFVPVSMRGATQSAWQKESNKARAAQQAAQRRASATAQIGAMLK